ncbi:MAG: DUF11 domain-containing protein, partial [Acidobacteria bacterium]
MTRGPNPTSHRTKTSFRRLASVSALWLAAAAVPSLALVPPRDPATPLPSPVQDEIRDDRAGAFRPAHPLAGVVPANVAARRAAGPLTLTPLTGSFSYPVLLGKFADTAADPFPPGDLADELFLTGYNAGGAPGSLRDYFAEVSYGDYDIDGTVYGWQTVSLNEADYTGPAGCNGLCRGTTGSAAAFVQELIQLNDGSIDFSQFDNDGPDGVPNSGDDDGVVDLLVVVQPAVGGECGGTGIWSHLDSYSKTFGAPYATDDPASGGGNIAIEDYIVVPAYECDGTTRIKIGVFAHLFGLHLGWPPLWDRDGTSRGAGAWDVMARGLWGGDGATPERPVHPSAYTKALAGWIDPVVILGQHLGEFIPAVESNREAREFRRPSTCTHEEYFLMEARLRQGFDLNLPGEGLLIWHADDSREDAGEEARPRLHLLPADSRYGLNNGRDDGDDGDPWPGSVGRKTWRDDTDPSSRRWEDRPSGASMTDVSPPADPIQADLNQDTGPIPHVLDVSIDDSSTGAGDRDGVIDPYETVRLGIDLSNEGQATLTGVTATLSLNPPVPGVTIPNPSMSWPDLDPCGVGSVQTVDVDLDASVACGTSLNFQLDISANEGTYTLNFTKHVGTFFPQPEQRLTSSAADAGKPRATADDTGYAVVYHEPGASGDVVRLTRLDADGVPLGTTDISAGSGNSRNADVDWNGTEYGIVWEDDRDGTQEIYFARADASGTRVGPEVRLTASSGTSRAPRIVWNSTNQEWAIVFADDRLGDSDVYLDRLDASGNQIGSEILIAGGAGDQAAPDLAWSGARYGVVWHDGAGGEYTIQFRSLTYDGSVISPPVRLEQLPGDSVTPAITWHAGSQLFGVAYIDFADGKNRSSVKTTRTDENGSAPATPKTISSVPIRAEAVDIDSDGTSYFYTWVDHRDGRRTVRLSRADALQNVDADSLIVGQAPYGDAAAIGYGPGGGVIVWRAEDSSTHRFDVHARTTVGFYECGRDDDGDGILTQNDNCPDTPNIDQTDTDGDQWGDACDCAVNDPNINPGVPEVNCDGTDNDCSAATPDSPDADGDGWDICDPADPVNPDGKGVDCDDSRADVFPGAIEDCDGADNDCDGTVDPAVGDRYVDTTGSDAGNLCNDPAAPCASIGHAAEMACDGETVFVAEGHYVEDIVIEQPVRVDASGIGIYTTVSGTGTTDVVTILASDVTWDGLEVVDTPGVACFRIGDAAHPDLSHVVIQNSAARNCAVGVVIDSTTSPGVAVSVLQSTIENHTYDGSPDSGIGILLVGGNDHVDLRGNRVRNNDGVGIRIDPPAAGRINRLISVVGTRIHDNGLDPAASGFAGIEAHDVEDIRIEGNRIYNQLGPDAGTDGLAAIFADISGGNVYCNRFESNDQGVRLTGTTDGLRILHNKFTGNTGTALLVGPDAGTSNRVNEDEFQGNGTAVENQSSGTLDARHSWWGAADGPSGDGPGSGDPILGDIDTSNFIARSTPPVLVRWPTDSGWSDSVAACFKKIQTGVDNANPGDLVLIGDGIYKEHVNVTKAVDLEGIDGGLGCSPTEIDGRQSGGTHDPALTISGVSGVDVRNLTIRSASRGQACGSSSGNEIGLNLENVSGSTFSRLCLKENGVTELRLYGDSDDNTFDDLTIDGMIRRGDGSDECGHRSREGILVDGGPACEGGPGATADRNSFNNIEINYATRGVKIRLATDTQVTNSTISASPAPAWDGGAVARAVEIEMADRTQLIGNTLGAGEETDTVVIRGRDAASCVTEATDSTGTYLQDNVISKSAGSGVLLAHAAGDPGVPADTEIRCNDISNNGTGVLTEWVGPATGAQNRLHLNDITGNTTGVQNTASDTLPAERNWWGSADGPGGAGPGSGDTVSGAVSFGNWLQSSSADDADADNYTECEGDCDDTDPAFSPGVAETCDGIDNDCDGSIDEDLPLNSYYRDADGDTFGDPNDSVQDCSDTPPAGYVADNSDCNDADPNINPNAAEIICDNVDQNCNGMADEAPDGDSDGFDQCDPSDPYDGDGHAVDCNDSDPGINPGAAEISCDNVDQNCNGMGDESPDADADGYDACDPADPFDGDGLQGDCDDADSAVNPAAAEVCNDTKDNDCNGQADGADAACTGLAVANLRFQAGTKDTLAWDAAASATSYALYRGTIRRDRPKRYDHFCEATEISGTTAVDRDVPQPGEFFYYLATGLSVNAGTGAITPGPLGQASDGSWRPESDTVTCGPRVYVDPDAVGAGTGTSWADAYTSVAAALGHDKARDRGLEIWIKGTVTDNGVSLDRAARPAARLLGGFAGTETFSWERDPAATPTVWHGSGATVLLRGSHADLVLDGLTLENATQAVRATTDGDLVAFFDVDVNSVTGKALEVTADGPAGGSLVVEDSSFDGSVQSAVQGIAQAGALTGRIARNSFGGGGDAVVRLESRPSGSDASVDFEVLRNRIDGGLNGLVVGAHVTDEAVTAEASGLIASNLLSGASGDAVRVEAAGDFTSVTGAATVLAHPVLTENTISDAAGSGVVAAASRSDTTGSPAQHAVRAVPELWNNLITFHGGASIEESADDTANALEADPLVSGNDLFGSGSLYLDEGTTTLTSVADVNALPQATGNVDVDPRYRDRASGDYVLRSSSPVIDTALDGAPPVPALDLAGSPRFVDGDADGTAAADLGAYEAPAPSPNDADIEASKTDDADPVAVGSQLVYTVRAENRGLADATNVVATDTLPPEVTFVSTSGCAEDPNGVPTCTLGTIAAGSFAEYTITVTVNTDVPDGSVITNSVDIATDTPESDTLNNTATETTTVLGPALTATKGSSDVNGGSLRPGDEIEYTVTVSNGGGAPATGVSMSDPVPANTTLVAGSASASQGTVTEGDPLQWDVGTLAAGASATLTFRVTVDAATPDGTRIENQATFTYSEDPAASVLSDSTDPADDDGIEQGNDPNDPNDDDTTKDTVGVPALSATKASADLNGGRLEPGDEIEYTISIRNDGTSEATGVSMSDPIPANTTLVAGSASPSQGTVTEGDPLQWDVGTIPAGGGQATLTFRVTVDAGTPDGTTIENQATFTYAEDPAASVLTDSTDPADDDGIEQGNDPNDPNDDDTTKDTVTYVVLGATKGSADLNGG